MHFNPIETVHCLIPFISVFPDGKIGGETVGVRSEKLPQGQSHRQRS